VQSLLWTSHTGYNFGLCWSLPNPEHTKQPKSASCIFLAEVKIVTSVTCVHWRDRTNFRLTQHMIFDRLEVFNKLDGMLGCCCIVWQWLHCANHCHSRIAIGAFSQCLRQLGTSVRNDWAPFFLLLGTPTSASAVMCLLCRVRNCHLYCV